MPTFVELGEAFAIEWTPALAAARDGDDDRYLLAFDAVLVLEFTLLDPFTPFVELESSLTSEGTSDWIGLLALGTAYDLDPDAHFELGLRAGLSRAAESAGAYAAFVRRF